jgi:tetratricopeptide (TPR) repeat protein
MHALPAVLARGFLADCLSLIGEFSEALVVGREAIQIAKTVGHTFSMVGSQALCGLVYVRKGDIEDGIPILEQGLELCQAYGMRQWLLGIVANLSLAYSLTGRSTAASITLDRVSEVIATAAIVTAGAATWGAELSQALLLANRVDDAKVLLDRFEDEARAAEQPVINAWIPRIRAEIALRRNPTDLGEAMAYYHRALEQGGLFGLRPNIAHCHLALSRLYRRAGKLQEAQEHLTSATTMYREMDMQFWLEQAAVEAGGRA